MQIGARIYYDISTGNYIFTTPEFDNAFNDITTDDDFNNYEILQERVRNTLGVIQLEYNSTDLPKTTQYYFHIENNAIVWDSLRPEISPVPSIEDRLKALENAVLALT